MERAESEGLMGVLSLLQQNPIIVDVGKPPEATPDISLDFVVGMFALAGMFLLAALVGSLIVARRNTVHEAAPATTVAR